MKRRSFVQVISAALAGSAILPQFASAEDFIQDRLHSYAELTLKNINGDEFKYKLPVWLKLAGEKVSNKPNTWVNQDMFYISMTQEDLDEYLKNNNDIFSWSIEFENHYYYNDKPITVDIGDTLNFFFKSYENHTDNNDAYYRGEFPDRFSSAR